MPSFLQKPLPVWIAVVLLFASSGLTIAGAWLLLDVEEEGSVDPLASDSGPPADRRELEYAKLARLRGGLSLGYFQDVLGMPWFVTPSEDSEFTQYLFRGQEYWVQAVVDRAGTVQLMAITACHPDFAPRFAEDTGSPQLGPIVLNRTRLAEVSGRPNEVRYFTSGATANSYYYDAYYLGNPGPYKTYFVGLNDACPGEIADDLRGLFLGSDHRAVQFDPADGAVRAFREGVVANTYAETGVFFDRRILDAFQIGADRILTRTAPPP